MRHGYQARRGRPTWGTMARAVFGRSRRGARRQHTTRRGPVRRMGKGRPMRRRGIRGAAAGRGSSAPVQSVGRLLYRRGPRKSFHGSVMRTVAPVQHVTAIGKFVVRSGANEQGRLGKLFLRGGPLGAGSDGSDMAAIAAVTSETNADNRDMTLYGTDVQIRMVSASNVLQEVTIYDIKAKTDHSFGDTDDVPVTCWDNSNYLVNGGVYPSSQLLDSRPNMGPKFGANYKITRTTRKVLNPGQGYVHLIKTVDNWRSTRGDYLANTTLTTIRNRTYGVLIVTKGYPVGTLAAPDSVAVGAVSLDCQWSFHCTYGYSTPAGHVYARITNLLDPLNVFANPIVMNDDSGTTVPVETN